MTQIGYKSPLLKHVASFKRFAFMVLKDNKKDLDLVLNFHHENHNYAILVTTNRMKCLNCGEVGHLVRKI